MTQNFLKQTNKLKHTDPTHYIQLFTPTFKIK